MQCATVSILPSEERHLARASCSTTHASHSAAPSTCSTTSTVLLLRGSRAGEALLALAAAALATSLSSCYHGRFPVSLMHTN